MVIYKITNTINNKIYIGQISAKGKTVETGTIYPSQMECSKELKIHQGNLHKVLCGKRKTTGGYSFRYLEVKNEK